MIGHSLPPPFAERVFWVQVHIRMAAALPEQGDGECRLENIASGTGHSLVAGKQSCEGLILDRVCRSLCCIIVLAAFTALGQTAPGKKHTSTPHSRLSVGDRVRWFVQSTVGPPALAGGVVSSGFATAMNMPRECGPGWAGFGKRYGMRLT